MRFVLATVVAFVLFAAAPAAAERHRFDDPPQDDQPFDAMTDRNGGIPDEQLRQDFDHHQFDGTMGARQQPAPMQPYWGTMRPYWNSSEPPGVIHRGARTRGFTKKK